MTEGKITVHLPEERHQVALVGNPNVGKSVLFGFLTGRYVTVSNYPGTTVEITRGHWTVGHEKVTLIDTPGVNTLLPLSEDEQVARDILFREKMDAVIQVADAKNLRRTLFLSIQLSEIGLPFLLNLNMEDESSARQIHVDKDRLSRLLGIPVVGTVAIEKRGLKELEKSFAKRTASSFQADYDPVIEEGIREIRLLLPPHLPGPRALALMILCGDKTVHSWLSLELPEKDLRSIARVAERVSRHFAEPVGYRVNESRMAAVDSMLREVLKQEAAPKEGILARFGEFSMHPVWGFLVLFGFLSLLYLFVGKFGAQIAVDWLENGLFGRYVNPAAVWLFSKLFFFSPFLRDLFVGPYGIITMALTYAFAIIFPIVLSFFLAFSVVEDSGYLPRLSIMLNRIFKVIGLNGKAVVPMVLGLGCDTMATMTARVMETRKERVILTLLLALAVPCSAQLGIILGMLSALPFYATVVWFSVVGGSLFLVGFLSSQILPGGRSEFLMEIPPIRRPSLSNIMAKTVARLEWYLKEVVPLFILGTLVLFFLDRSTLLTRLESWGSPLVEGMLGLPRQATEAFLIGFLRRDYGATHFFEMFEQGRLDSIQALVSLVTMTLFVPCLANFLMIIKERGMAVAIGMIAFIYPFAFAVGGILNWGLRL